MEQYELYHHGILGMRWGVRRYQNKDGSLTPAGKKHYKDDDIVRKKGNAFSHISDRSKLNMKNRSTFLMEDYDDMRVYGGTYGMAKASAQYRKSVKNPKIYAHVFKTKHGGVIAGEKAMRETFNNLLSKKNSFLIAAMKPGYELYKQRGQIKNNSSYEEFCKDNDRMFRLFTKTSLNHYSSRDSRGEYNKVKNNPYYVLGRMYTESLQHKKYIGMLDLNDKNTWYGAKQPMIVFNGKQFLEDKYVQELSIESMSRMGSALKEKGLKSTQKTELI